MVEETLRRFAGLDSLVLCAGVQHVQPLHDFPLEQWDRLNNVMLRGSFLAVKAAWEPLCQSGRGRIVVIASVSSFVAEPFKAAYAAAKHGVLGLVKVAALEGGRHGLCVNAVAPGLMMTPMIQNQLEEQERLTGKKRSEVLEDWVSRQAVKRPVETSEVARMVAFLASDDSSGITGTCIPVDLGLLAAE